MQELIEAGVPSFFFFATFGEVQTVVWRQLRFMQVRNFLPEWCHVLVYVVPVIIEWVKKIVFRFSFSLFFLPSRLCGQALPSRKCVFFCHIVFSFFNCDLAYSTPGWPFAPRLKAHCPSAAFSMSGMYISCWYRAQCRWFCCIEISILFEEVFISTSFC